MKIYFSRTKDLDCFYNHFEMRISRNERIRADRFRFEEDRTTYIASHAILRLILSWHLKKDPLEIEFVHEENSKPAIAGNPVHFNLSHTRDAFAIAVSDGFHVGIDLEDLNRKLDLEPMISTCFSSGEKAFIMEGREEASDRFFMLWTRKEAYLKALGKGISCNLGELGVLHKNRFLKNGIQKDMISHSVCNGHFLYSRKINNYYMSVAVPEKSLMRLIQIKEKNLIPLFG